MSYVVFPDYLHFTNSPDQILEENIKKLSPDKVAILVDENTKKHCYPSIRNMEAKTIQISSGEKNKNLNTCEFIWDKMTELGLSRQSLLVNLGGGVIGDMGGFAASTFKRGMAFINMPTTLLSMVDASIGGKLGIDFKGLKNHIGIFNEPVSVIVCSDFLKSLPTSQLISGYAEILKHGLISDTTYWKEVSRLDFDLVNWSEIIERSIGLKNAVVMKDPYEMGRRKILNFGHSFGHAIETHFLETNHPLFHGEAIAIGMLLEAHISFQKKWLTESDLGEIEKVLSIHFRFPELPTLVQLIESMLQDKKNQGVTMKFSLLKGIGNCEYDVQVKATNLKDALEYYRKIR